MNVFFLTFLFHFSRIWEMGGASSLQFWSPHSSSIIHCFHLSPDTYCSMLFIDAICFTCFSPHTTSFLFCVLPVRTVSKYWGCLSHASCLPQIILERCDSDCIVYRPYNFEARKSTAKDGVLSDIPVMKIPSCVRKHQWFSLLVAIISHQTKITLKESDTSEVPKAYLHYMGISYWFWCILLAFSPQK